MTKMSLDLRLAIRDHGKMTLLFDACQLPGVFKALMIFVHEEESKWY